MVKMTKFKSIEQFRHICSNVYRVSTFIGLDENNKPIYDNNLKKPVIKAIGTVKLHGTNAGIVHNFNDGIWFKVEKE